jgi:DNA invertase Pin-like site-specific DNA recombinase
MSNEHKAIVRCAIYTRKSSEEGLEQSFNSLDAQREACQAFIASQRQEGWKALSTLYDDGGYSGGSMERPGLRQLLEDVQANKVDIIVVYKVDRLTRSLADFAKIVETLDARGVSFVSVTQQFNTTSSMGRLTLNILLSFAQFEREVTGERIRDKIAASKRKGMWMGGTVPLGYDVKERKLVVNPEDANLVCELYRLYLKLGCIAKLKAHLDGEGITSKVRVSAAGRELGGTSYSRGALYHLLRNRIFLGETSHAGQSYRGEHEAIVPRELWDRVQAQLKSNTQGLSKRPRVTSPSMLTGLLRTADGNLFTPSHTVKKGRRYRYYICGTARPCRLPAHQIESLVLSRLKSFLVSANDVIDLLCLPSDSASSIQKLTTEAQNSCKGWFSGTATSTAAIVSKLVNGVVVHLEKVEVLVSKPKLRDALMHGLSFCPTEPPNTAGDTGDLVHLNVDARLKRCGGEVRLVVPPRSAVEMPAHPVPSLLKAMARSHDWHTQIIAGKLRGRRALADQAGLDERYVSRILQCAFLAPDIVEAILAGRQPADFSMDKLRTGLPLSWAEQRQRFGFPARS